MRFLWPDLLWLLLLVPLLVGAYLWLLRRKKKTALRYANLALVREAMTSGGGVRRHLPPLLFLIALTLLLIAIARPAAVVTLPTDHETIVLAIDVSGSMRADDVKPTRLEAAQAAARTFVNEQPRNVDIGIVSFAGTAAVVQAPTQNRDDLLAAIDRLQLQRATAVGSGLLVALKLIVPDVEFDLRFADPRATGRDERRDQPLSGKRESARTIPKPVAPGSNASAAIILLTDGATTTGPDPVEAARIAADNGVRVYTVGLGTPEGAIIGWEGWSMRVRLDEETLKTISGITRAEYFRAGTAEDLDKVYRGMNARMVLQRKETEVTALFAAAAAVFAVAAAGLSLAWFGRVL
ncbi:MAG TPA: VWA domain-containing protein [Casimicrobiaceae bacterium]|nr:VWA domain-containing protein [Casimicrobiaceae bacterium]